MSASVEAVLALEEQISRELFSYGFETRVFKVGWYNEQVAKSFKLQYPEDTVAFVLVSTPSMFEKAFLPYLSEKEFTDFDQDPIDECMRIHFKRTFDKYSEYDVEIIHDFELTPSRRPKVLVQTAGHVAGAVRYYQQKDVSSDAWPPGKRIYGVCLHPLYGGWFALRGIVVFRNLLCPTLQKVNPVSILESEEQIIELLDRYNGDWKNWSFRDIIPPRERYSELQKEYFLTKPAERKNILSRLKNSWQENNKKCC